MLQHAEILFAPRNDSYALSTTHPIALIFLPASDIPSFISSGNVDLGITGQDMIQESLPTVPLRTLLALSFGRCDLCVQVPLSSPYTKITDLIGRRIVTSFTNITTSTFAALSEIPTQVQFVSGSVEAACLLGSPDAIVDLVESGATMRAAKLHAIHTIMTSEAVLVCNAQKYHQKREMMDKVVRRMQGMLDAQKYVLVNYNVERGKLGDCVKITPGKKAPTISPLEDGDWVAVSSMILHASSVTILDALEKAGAVDILLFEIQNCRKI